MCLMVPGRSVCTRYRAICAQSVPNGVGESQFYTMCANSGRAQPTLGSLLGSHCLIETMSKVHLMTMYVCDDL